MSYYIPEKDFEPHDFISSVLTVNSVDLTGAVVIGSLDTIEVELAEDKWDDVTVASGQSIDVKVQGSKGTIKFTFLDADSSSETMSTLARSDAPITISFTDANAPLLNCSSGQGRVAKHAMVKREGKPDIAEWTVKCRTMKCETGGYRLQQVV